MTLAIILVTLLSLIILLLLYCLLGNRQYWKQFNVKGPEPSALFGNYRDVILRRVTSFDFHEKIYNSHPNEKVVGLYRFNTPVLLLRDLDIVQQVFIRDFDSFVNRGIEFGDKLSTNLGSSCDNTWRLLRTRFSPIFTSGKLKNMLHLVERCGDQLLEHLDATIPSSIECDVVNITKRYAIMSISACVFGIDRDMTKPDEKLEEVNKMIFTQYQALELFYVCPELLKKMHFNALPKKISEYFIRLVDEVINKQRNGVPSNRKDFMDLLLEMKNMTELKGGKKNDGDEITVLPVTDEVIAAQAMVFHGAGMESSATTLAFALHELAKNQDVQEKLFQEIKQQVFEKNNGELSLETLKQLTYMSQVFDETLRMYPIIDLQRKVSASSVQIPGTDITLKRDDYIFVPIRGIHYDEKYYPDPYKFDPERFSPENVKSRHPCAFLPFGLGPRHCIGARFATVQNRLFLVKFLSHYKVEPPAVMKKFTYNPMKITLAATDGVPLKITRRNIS
ncbi:hypothetical protein evm_003301 [Chilo suppressalis]|nr:hypothetical protein evm_003301 [Chilo suppressalis]